MPSARAKRGGDGSARGHEQLVRRRHQIALRGHAAARVGAAVRLRHLDLRRGRIVPQHLAGRRVHRDQKHAFRLPDTGGPIQNVISDHGPAASRPFRDHGAVAQHPRVVRTAPPFADQRTVGGVQAVQVAVIADGKHAVPPNGGSKPNGRVGEKGPAFRAAGGVQSVHLAVGRTAKVDASVSHRDVVRAVELHPLLARPSRRGRMQRMVAPLQRQLARQRLVRVSAACRVAAIRGPVVGRRRETIRRRAARR